ncbi:MAG: chemotaxis protein CheD [Peptococcaceae bacterium]|nr:chemotaxis protein CheD [Peptococcaceae bacterium]
MNKVLVGMGDFKISKVPDTLMTIGLGSCLGVCIFDQSAKVAGMAHIMLPTSRYMPHNNPMKYADTCLSMMLNEIDKVGGNRLRLKAKIAGGAQMFATHDDISAMHIGEKNMVAVSAELKKYGIPIVSQDVGGNVGRTITFHIATSELHIKTARSDNFKVI